MKKEVIYAVLLAIIFSIGVEAATVSITELNSTKSLVSIEDAANLYAYEINFSISGATIGSVQSFNFLGATSQATYSSNQRNSHLYVYGSKLNSSQIGVSGSGNLFNITHTGNITLKGHTLVDNAGNVDYQPYNTGAVCGNDIVEDGEECDDENTESGDGCSATCQDEEGGGGGEGGGGTTTTTNTTINETADAELEFDDNEDLIVEPREFNINTVQGEETEREFTITNRGPQQINLRLSTSGDLSRGVTSFDDSEFIIQPGETRTVEFGVLFNSKGLKTGKILIINGKKIVKEIPVIANVLFENFLFDVKLEIPEEYKNTINKLQGDVELLQVGPQLKVDVVATYVIKDLEGNEYWREEETFFIVGEKKYSKEIDVSDLEAGKYVLGLEIAYPGAFGVASAQFNVDEGRVVEFAKDNLILVSAAGVVVIVSLGIAAWALMRRKKIKRWKRKS